MAFADRLKQLRKDAGLSQQQLAEKLGISARVLGYYESGERFPKDEETLISIARAFQVSLDYLFDNPVRQASACPSRYCYMKTMDLEDRARVNDFILFMRWKSRHSDGELEEFEGSHLSDPGS